MVAESSTVKGTKCIPNENAVKILLANIGEMCTTWTELLHAKVDLFNNEDVYVNESNDEHDSQRNLDQDDLEIWKILCFLLKGTFYLINGIPLKALNEETSNQFLLHAAAAILPVCQKTNRAKSAILRFVWDRILHLHGEQISQEGPFLRRFPLHIAVATSIRATAERPSPVDPAKADTNLQLGIFKSIMDRSPTWIASVQDASGNYPFHLACASGYSWSEGLETLFRAAPVVAHCSCTLLLMGKPNQSKKKRRNGFKWFQTKSCKAKKQHLDAPTAEEIDALNTVFQLLQTDPSIAFRSLRQSFDSGSINRSKPL